MLEVYHDITTRFYYQDLKVINAHVYENGVSFNIGTFTPFISFRHQQTQTFIGTYSFTITSATNGTAVYTVAPTLLSSPGLFEWELGLTFSGSETQILDSGLIHLRPRLA
jgi:hypothetical protein